MAVMNHHPKGSKMEYKESGKGKRLTDKQLRFAEEYLVDLNAAKAVLRAGYNTTNPRTHGYQLLNHPLIREEIEKGLEAKKERNLVSEQYVLEKLRYIVEEQLNDNPQAALRGLELLGKNLGMYKDRQEISGPDGEAIEFEQRTKQKVNELTSKLARLANSNGTGEVVKFPDRGGEG